MVSSTIDSIDAISESMRFRPLIALFDSGGSDIMMNRNAIPKGAIEIADEQKSFTITAGDLHAVSHVSLSKIFLPEFSRTRHIPTFPAYIFGDPGKKVVYDFIFGRNFLQAVGIQLDFSESKTIWLDLSVPMRPHHYWHNTFSIRVALRVDPPSNDISDSFAAAPIADASYGAADLVTVIAEQEHLSTPQRNALYRVLLAKKELCSGKLGTYPHKQFSLTLKPDDKPFHSKPYC
jgi:hypothetical protein